MNKDRWTWYVEEEGNAYRERRDRRKDELRSRKGEYEKMSGDEKD